MCRKIQTKYYEDGVNKKTLNVKKLKNYWFYGHMKAFFFYHRLHFFIVYTVEY